MRLSTRSRPSRGSLSRADGPEMDAAVECLSATPPEVGAARVAALAADERAAAPAAEALPRATRRSRRARARGRSAVIRLATPRGFGESRARARAETERRAGAVSRARWLEEAAALHRGEGLATVAALAAAWAPGPASTLAGDPERDARALPATLPATTRTIAREGVGDGVGGEVVAAVASSLVESAARGDAERRRRRARCGDACPRRRGAGARGPSRRRRGGDDSNSRCRREVRFWRASRRLRKWDGLENKTKRVLQSRRAPTARKVTRAVLTVLTVSLSCTPRSYVRVLVARPRDVHVSGCSRLHGG